MWLLFAVIGFVLGESSSGLGGAVLGGLLGYALARLNRVEARLKVLEDKSARASAAALEWNPATQADPGPAPAAPAAAIETTARARPAASIEPAVGVDIPAQTKPAATVTAPPPRASAPPSPPWSSGLLARLLSGNILAKLGMVLLFFGIASALKLAVEHGMLPPHVRLLAAVVAGLACIWLGTAPASGRPFRPAWLFRFAPVAEQARTGFGFALEGGGFGILYIATWFALDQYGYIGPATAFLLFAGLGATSLALAVRQDSQSFALLGVLGGFLAPALVPSQGDHLILFGYLVLLDAGILAVSLYRAWRLLISVSLVATLLLGGVWADLNYHAGLRGDVELFLLALFVLYTATPWLAARRGPPAQWGWQSALLLFAPATAAAVVQAALYAGDTGFLALSSLGAGLWYGLLHRLTRPTGDALLGQAQAGLALTFLSLAPYLAYSQNVAGVFWALEGGGLVWYGMRSARTLPVLAGTLLQLLAGLLLVDLWLRGVAGPPFRDSLFHASLLLVATGALSSYATRSEPGYHRPFLAWTLVWWFTVFHHEFERSLTGVDTWVAMLALAAATATVLEWVGRRLDLTDARAASLLVLPAMMLVLAAAYADTGHPLAHGLWLVFPLALAAHGYGLFRQEADGLAWFVPERHAAAYWLLAWAVAWEAWWLATQIPALGPSLAEALRALALAAAVAVVLRGEPDWPFGRHRATLLRAGLALPVVLAWLWLFASPIGLSGTWALPYVPVLNPLEGAALVLLWALYRHWQATARFGSALGYPALFGLALLYWFSQALARSVHHWAGVPYLSEPLWHSGLLQALLSLGWTAAALVVMVLASRRLVRPAWFAGLGLLLVVCAKLVVVDLANVDGMLRVLSLIGIGLLVLGAGYLAPVPPRSGVATNGGKPARNPADPP